MTHGEMQAEVVSYLTTADQLPLRLIDEVLWQGTMSIFRRMRAAGHWRTIRPKYLALVADQDLYDPGPEVAEILKMERMGGGRSTIIAPLDPRQDQLEDDSSWTEGPAYTYVPLPDGRFRLLEKPASTTSAVEGLRIWFRPRPVRLENTDQVPDFPEATHEGIVVAAVERALLKDGVGLANARGFDQFRMRAEAELASYLVPSFEGAPADSYDRLGIYSEEAY